MSVNPVFIVWNSYSRRAETLAAELKGRVSFQYEDKLKGPWVTPLRYLVQGWKTWCLLERERPEAVLVQSPPIFAPLVVAAWCKLRGKLRPPRYQTVYVLDCHTGTFYSRKWGWAKPLVHLLSRRAAVTLCHDEGTHDILQSWRVKSFLLPDGLPTMSPANGTVGSTGELRVAVIGSLDRDEPVAEVFAAAGLLPHVAFYVTGDSKKVKAKTLVGKPENVILTGFLRDGSYTGLLKNVHGLVVLTNQPKAVNCAAYEAVAMEKPAVISDWPDLRRCFTRGFVYVTNTPEAIANGIKKMLNEQVKLIPEVIALNSELAARRQSRFEELAALLESRQQI